MPSDVDEDAADRATAEKNNKDSIYDPKPKPKIIRVLTVIAYVLSVSLVAILLSVYYVFMWDGQPTLAGRVSPQARISYRSHHQKEYYHGSTAIDYRQGLSESNNTNGSTARKSSGFDVLTTPTLINFTNFGGDFSSSSEMLQMRLPLVTSTTEDVPIQSTSTEDNSWLVDSTNYSDYNSELEELSKRSIFMKKIYKQRYDKILK